MKIHSIKNASNDHEIFAIGKNSGPIELTEFGDHSIGIALPSAVTALPLLVTISGTLEIKAREVAFQFIARAKVTDNPTGGRSALLLLSQYDKDLWQEFIGQRRGRQERAEKIFRSIKGEDPT